MSKIFPKMETQIVTLTPELCKELLRNNQHNRSPSKQAIQLLANQMKSGEWRLNGESIIISDDGVLMDGQHRLYACIEAGVPFETVIVRNSPRDCFATIDTGKSRSGGDVLKINGLPAEVARICAAAAGLCITFERHHSISNGGQWRHETTPKRRAEWVENNLAIIDIAEQIIGYGRTARIIPAGEVSFLWFTMLSKDGDSTEEFFRGALSGANLGEKDPRLALRQRMESMKFSTRKFTRMARIGAVIRSWDWFCRGKQVLYPANMFRDLEQALELLR